MIISTANKISACPDCGRDIEPGDAIAMTRRAYGFLHAECMLDLERMRSAGVSRRERLAAIRERVSA